MPPLFHIILCGLLPDRAAHSAYRQMRQIFPAAGIDANESQPAVTIAHLKRLNNAINNNDLGSLHVHSDIPTTTCNTSCDVQEPTERPAHLVIQIVESASKLLLTVLGGLSLVDARPVVGRIPSEGDVQSLQEGIHAC